MDARKDFTHLVMSKLDTDSAAKALEAFDVIMSRYKLTPLETGLTAYNPTDEPILTYYIESCRLDGLKESTLNNKKRHIQMFLNFVNTPIKQISTLHCRAFMASVADRAGSKSEKINEGTYNSIRSSVSAFLEWCVKEDIINRNPMTAVKRKKEVKEIKKSITEVEVEKLRRAAKTEQEKLMIEIMLGTGCRISELRLLKASDFDFRNGRILLYGVKTNEYRESIVNGKMEVALADFLKVKKNESEYLFASERRFSIHETVSTKAIENMFQKICARSGIKRHINPHDTRRTFATMQTNSGTGVVAVQHLLGHKSLATTQTYLDSNAMDFSEARRHCA